MVAPVRGRVLQHTLLASLGPDVFRQGCCGAPLSLPRPRRPTSGRLGLEIESWKGLDQLDLPWKASPAPLDCSTHCFDCVILQLHRAGVSSLSGRGLRNQRPTPTGLSSSEADSNGQLEGRCLRAITNGRRQASSMAPYQHVASMRGAIDHGRRPYRIAAFAA